MKAKIDEHETNRKIKNIRLVYVHHDFKKCSQPRNNIAQDEKGDLITDAHSILAKWMIHFSQLFIVLGVNNVRQIETRTVVPVVPEPSAFKVQTTTEKLQRHKSLGFDQILGELIIAVGRINRSEIHILINSISNKEKLPEAWKKSINVPIYKKGDKKKDCSNYRGNITLATIYKILSNILLSRLTLCAVEIIGDYQCRCLYNRYSTHHIFCIHKILEKK
jgi:hypothetical protein